MVNSEKKELIVYNRSYGCPYWSIAEQVLKEHKVAYQVILIDQDEEAMRRVMDWTGFKSIPTLVVANAGEVLPYEQPSPLAPGQSPRGIDRGSMLTEAGAGQIRTWLKRHGFIQ